MSNIIGIDQSFTKTGIWILDQNKDTVFYGTISTAKSDGSVLEKVKRAVIISEDIIELCKRFDVSSIVIEGLGFGLSNSNATRDLGGLQFIIIENLVKNGFSDIEIVAPTSLKKIATGSGKAKKNELFDALPDHIKEILVDIPKSKGRSDLTDAYWLAYSKNLL